MALLTVDFLYILFSIRRVTYLNDKLTTISNRPLKPSDLQPLHLVASDKLIWQQHPQQRRVEYEYFRDQYFNPALQYKSSLTLETHGNQIKGCTRYYNYRPEYRDIAIGYTFISRDCWGTDVNKQMKYLMMRHVYSWVDVIYFIVEGSNSRSRKAVQKLGCRLLSQEDKRQRNIQLKASKVIFQINKDSFEKSPYFKSVL